jgi:hypothetical protein
MSDPKQPPRANPDPAADRTPTTPTASDQPPADATAPIATPDPGHHPAPPGKGATVGRVVRHRATQLVAVGLLGLVLGGGIVALADRDRDHHHRYGVGSDRPEHSRFDERGERWERGDRGERGERGPDRPGRDFER